MKSIHFRRMCLLLSLCMLLSLLPFAAFASSDNPDAVTGKAHTSYDYAEIYQAAEIIASGKCGKYVYWKLDKDGVLTIFGSGKTDNYSPILVPEWKPYLEQIKSVVVEDGVTSIGYYMFYFHDITKVSLADSVETLSNGAFYGCDQLTDVTLGSGLKKIDELAFRECVSLKEITISDSVTEICSYAFYNCAALAGITIPDQVTYVGPLAFYGCTALKEVHLGKNVEELGFSVFNGCKSLQYIELPESLEFISEGVFFGCSNLYAVVIPKSITEIRDVAFGNCEKLWHVLYTGTQEQWNQVSVGSDNNYLKDAIRHDLAHGDEIELLQKLQCEEKILYRCTFCDDEVTEPFPGGTHTWADATCTAPKTCTNCGATKGSVSGSHTFVNNVCTDCGAIQINETTFPDENFRGYITSETYGADNVLTQEEVQNVTSIDVYNKKIKDLTGVQYFTALRLLDCSSNQLTTLDVSSCTVLENLRCDNNRLVSLDVTNLTVLEILRCSNNQRIVSATNNQFDLYSLTADGFDITKVSNWQGGTVTGNILTVTAETITYTYNMGNGKTEIFTLVIDSFCSHTWLDATCTTPKTCNRCGATEGEQLKHEWIAADCDHPKHCKNCTATEGSALDHTWKAATCSNPKTCTACGATSGYALGHDWAAGNCTTPKTCKVCGAKDGGVVHTYEHQYDYKCDLCGTTRIVDMTRPMVDMFRMYNHNTGEHFYTGSTVERDNLISVGWQYEGVGFTFPLTTGKPVYRLFQPSTGEHLYTMDESEKAKLMAEGWNYEGIAFNSGFENEVPQYRLWNPNATVGAYHFTASQEEKDNLLAAGWIYQGIGWYSLGA